jgi:hypothetical protein
MHTSTRGWVYVYIYTYIKREICLNTFVRKVG